MLPKLSLPAEEKSTVEEICCNHSKAHLRLRPQIILLRPEGFSIEVLSQIAKTRKYTVYDWLKRYGTHDIPKARITIYHRESSFS